MASLRLTGSILVATAAAAALGLSALPASAATSATTYKVTPGGSFTGKSGTTTLTDTNTGTQLVCKSAAASGTLKSGSGLAGAGLGSIKTISFTTCTGPLGLTFTVKPAHLPWTLNATSYKSGVTKGTITGIHATLSGTGCTATVDGTSATADNGKVAITYTNSSAKLAVLAAGGNLHVYNVSGCAGLLNSGDASTFVASFAVSPKQTITGS